MGAARIYFAGGGTAIEAPQSQVPPGNTHGIHSLLVYHLPGVIDLNVSTISRSLYFRQFLYIIYFSYRLRLLHENVLHKQLLTDCSRVTTCYLKYLFSSSRMYYVYSCSMKLYNIYL